MCSADQRHARRDSDRHAPARALNRMLCSVAAAALLALAPAAESQAAAAVIIPPVPVVQDGTAQQQSDDGTVEQQALRGGAYRSPGGSFSGGGARGGVAPGGGGYRTGPRTPSPDVTRTPRTTTPGGGAGFAPGRIGTFLGGIAAGALLGHLLNPFAGFGGGGYGFGMSLISIIIWAGLLYVAYRVIRRLFGGGWRR